MLIKYDPWFQPPLRRILITAVCAGWLIFELTLGDEELGLWAMIAGAVTGLAVWNFFLSGDYRQKPAGDSDPEPPTE